MSVRFFDNSLKELSDDIDLSQQRSFLYGDGHFTTAKIIDGKIEHLERHLERLKYASQTLKFNPILWKKLTDILQQTAQSYDLAVIKVQICRGSSQRGYGSVAQTNPLIIISCNKLDSEWLANQQQPITLFVADTQLGIQPQLAGLKHCNRLEQVLIAAELERKKLEDGLVLNINNHIVETNKANIFWYYNKQWFTPCLKQSGVNGIMRQHILSRMNVEVVEKTLEQLLAKVEAMVICNSLIGIRPVNKIIDKPLSLIPVNQLIARL